MFEPRIYSSRREELKKSVGSGIILFPGNKNSPRNFASMPYPFRQDSSFLYYFGLDFPDLFGVIDADNGDEIIFGDDRTVDDVVWMGPEPPLAERAAEAGVNNTQPLSELNDLINKAISEHRKVHFLPQYRSDNMIFLSDITGIKAKYLNKYVSETLIKSVVSQRSVKIKEEIEEIEKALEISFEMYFLAMRLTKPGIFEKDIARSIEGIANLKGAGTSFGTIFSVHGEILHNEYYENIMKEGDIALLDSGAETEMHYASDITRVIPVSGKFSERQKDIYNIVLDSQLKAIEMIKEGVRFKDVHVKASKVIASGLKEIGLMKGNVDDAVENGAHALFFPHGLGHMMGLDVHDMESFGEDYVGYDDKVKRSNQFGLAYLRLGKELKSGYVVTVEPGIYFIPALIDQWKNENKHADFINYDKLEEYRDFGGIRIEDDILVEKEGAKVLGKPIPKTVEEVELVCGK